MSGAAPMATWVRWLARGIGAPRAEVELLAAAFATDARRRRELRAPAGVPANAVEVILAMYLGMSGLAIASLAWKLAAFPGLAALLLSSLHLTLLAALLQSELYAVLLADEGYRVIASWPVRSQSFFLARLLSPTRRALALTLLLMVPSAAVLTAHAPLAGLAFLLAALVAAVVGTWAIAAVYALLLRVLGAPRLRVLGIFFQALGLIAPVVGSALLGKRIDVVARVLTEPPWWWPGAWVAALVELVIGQASASAAFRLGLGVVVAPLIPVAALRAGARVYAAGLASARVQAGRARLLAGLSRLARGQRAPQARVIATLLLAHARGDWRFRAQALLVPALGLGLALAALAGVDVRTAFLDPLVHDRWLHPAMAFVAFALLLPLLAVPVMARSSDHGAAWIMRTGLIEPEALERAARGLLRLVFVLPLLALAAGGYLIAGVELTSVLAHVLTLGLLAEVALRGAQRMIRALPFSLAPDDEDLQRTVAALVMLAYSICLLVGALIVHLVYRHWLAIVGFDLYLLHALRSLPPTVLRRDNAPTASRPHAASG